MENLKSRYWIFQCAIILGLVGLWQGSPVSYSATEDRDGILVERDRDAGTIMVVIPSHRNQLDWNDVIRGLARACRLDEDPLSLPFVCKKVDLADRSDRLSIRTLSAAIPDVHIRVVEHPATNEPALSIQLDQEESRQKIRRIKSLIREKFGQETKDYGLLLDSEWDKQPKDRPLVILIHGYGSGPNKLEKLHAILREQHWPTGMFSYPNDGPLQESAARLAMELSRFGKKYPDRSVTIVAHSMGGLVVRAAIEDPDLDPGNVDRLIMTCTPNHGTKWADVPLGLDGWEHLESAPEKTFQDLFRASVADGLNEARADLKPGSTFLRELNARPRHPEVDYSLILGTGAPWDRQRLDAMKDRTSHWLKRNQYSQIALPRVQEFFDGLDELEAGKGDCVVAVKRGRLQGVEDTLLLPITHCTLTNGSETDPAHRKLIQAILNRLKE